MNALYSTPSLYTDAKHATDEKWPLKTDDFFPWVKFDVCISVLVFKNCFLKCIPFFKGMQIIQMLIGPGTLQVVQDLKVTLELWVVTIWYILSLFYLFRVSLKYLAGFYCLFLNIYWFFILMNRQLGSWSFLKEGLTQGQTLRYLLMLWQLLNIMMQLVVQKDITLLLIMLCDFLWATRRCIFSTTKLTSKYFLCIKFHMNHFCLLFFL